MAGVYWLGFWKDGRSTTEEKGTLSGRREGEGRGKERERERERERNHMIKENSQSYISCYII